MRIPGPGTAARSAQPDWSGIDLGCSLACSGIVENARDTYLPGFDHRPRTCCRTSRIPSQPGPCVSGHLHARCKGGIVRAFRPGRGPQEASWPLASAADGARAERERLTFLDPRATIAGTSATVAEARRGAFHGSEFPATCSGSGFRARVPPGQARRSRTSIRNVAYALLSGADGWMFDGEDALGQVVDDVARQPAKPEAGDRTATRCS